VFNQEDDIKEIVEKLLNDYPSINLRVEDAGSYDNTYGILLDLEKEHENLCATKL